VDILTGTLGKALGGASGGYVAARAEVVEMLRQRARPYLFSNTLAPVITATTLRALDLVADSGDLRARLEANAAISGARCRKLGFTLAGAGHPIIPVMLGDAALAGQMAERLLERGVYVTAFSFPVVPKGRRASARRCRRRTPRTICDRAIAAFAEVGRELGIIG
jgi:glycine C-acetyltransferase